MIMTKKAQKRKVDSECRTFKEQWNVKYFVIEFGSKALCLICKESIAVLKEYNICRHYETKHTTKYSNYTGNLRLDKFIYLKRDLSSQQSIFQEIKHKNEAPTRASFRVAHILTKKGSPFADGELIKQCLMEVAQEICPEKLSLFREISLSANTVARRVEDIGKNIMSQLYENIKTFEWFSLALDESTDILDTSQLLLFIRGIDKDFKVTEELASVHSMHGTTTGENIFKEVEKSLSKYNLKWKNLKCVTTDGGRNMCGKNTGFIGQIIKACANEGYTKPIVLQCIIHQQALCAKYLNMDIVLEPVIATVNFIRSNGLNHRQFRKFLEEMGSEHNDLPYHTRIRWLSCGKVLSRFFELRNEIAIFLNEKKRPLSVLSCSLWLWKLAFFADLTKHINELNLRLQGENGLLSDMYTNIKSFRQKLLLFESQLKQNNFNHFKCCERFRQETDAIFPFSFAIDIVSDLRSKFLNRFADLDNIANDIKMFQNPYDCNVESITPDLQMELIDLQSDDSLKEKYKNGNLLEFYQCLPEEKFSNLKNFARGLISIFGTTYMCEKTFSKMKYVKSNYRSNLSDEHLESILIIGSTKFDPEMDAIMNQKSQLHTSH